MAGILGTIKGFFGKGGDKGYEIADIYRELRNKVLALDPSEIGLSPSGSNRVWGMLVEIGYPQAVATLVTTADGTVSLYFSNGGGILGVGEHEGPAKACDSFLALAPKYIEYAEPAEEFPLPKKGNTRFYFFTYDGIFTVEDKEADLGKDQLPLSPLYHGAHEVITQARIVDEQLKTEFENFLQAVITGDTSGVKTFLEEGADPDSSDENGRSALMAAAYTGKYDVLEVLIEGRCSIDAGDSTGYTALMFAVNAEQVNEEHAKCVKALIEAGADVNAKDNEGSTPLMFAAQHGHNELVSLLLEKGADPAITGSHGLSAIDFAKQNGHKETEAILRGN